VSQRQFAQSFNEQDLVELLIKSVKTVTDSLSPTYTQIADMNAQINEILRHEVSRFLEAQKRRAPKNSRLPLDILDYFPRLERISQEEISQAMNKKAVDGKTALRWYVIFHLQVLIRSYNLHKDFVLLHYFHPYFF